VVRYRPKERLSTTRRGCIRSVQRSGQGIVPNFPCLSAILERSLSGCRPTCPSLELADILSGDKSDGDEDGSGFQNLSVHDFVPDFRRLLRHGERVLRGSRGKQALDVSRPMPPLPSVTMATLSFNGALEE
jgi:hypothetical protein